MSEPHVTVSPKKQFFGKAFFHNTSLIPFFAFVGLGADSISSSCYGPEEAFLSLNGYYHLIVFVGLLAILTISIISTSYCQIIKLFPHGGGGYVVASKLLSPGIGVVSGAALLVDYVLTITISVASGVDAIFSMLPGEHHQWKLAVKVLILGAMTMLNVRGIKESIFPWIPVFLLFAFTHIFAFVWAAVSHFTELPLVQHGINLDITHVYESAGLWGLLFLILKSYSMGAGTYTGIEAVSNGMNIFREPRVENARKTMLYMSIALAVTVSGLIISYLLYHVEPTPGKTLNGVLLLAIGKEIPHVGPLFAFITLFSEAALLVMAAQSGFLGGPRILANMATDNWLPHKFTNLSDRFVMRHGILLISAAALLLMLYSGGSVAYLVVLYSLAVFITFSSSQLGMVSHWAKERLYNRPWVKGLLINGFGCVLTLFILVSLALIKFAEGAWLTLLVIAILTFLCYRIKSYYTTFAASFRNLSQDIPIREPTILPEGRIDRSLHTAVLCVSGATDLTLHSISELIRLFGNSFEHFIFLHVGIIDAGSFKGENELQRLEEHTKASAAKLVKHMEQHGYSAESFVSVGTDLGDEVTKLATEVRQEYPSCIFIGGQLILPKETILSHWMHNQLLFTLQRRLFELEFPFVTIPVYIERSHKS